LQKHKVAVDAYGYDYFMLARTCIVCVCASIIISA